MSGPSAHRRVEFGEAADLHLKADMSRPRSAPPASARTTW